MTLNRQLFVLTSVPLIGCLILAGVIISRAYQDREAAIADGRVIAAYSRAALLLGGFEREFVAEREVGARVLAGLATDEQFREAEASTDQPIHDLMAEMDRIGTGPYKDTFKVVLPSVREPLRDALRSLRSDILARKMTVAKLVFNYSKIQFNCVRLGETYRSILTSPDDISRFDGVYTADKMREQEAILDSMLRLSVAGVPLAKDDMGMWRKQYFTLAEAETSLRRYFPDLRAFWDPLLRTDPVSQDYYKHIANISNTVSESKRLPDFADAPVTGYTHDRYQRYADVLEKGLSMMAAASDRNVEARTTTLRNACLVLAGIMAASILTALTIARLVSRRLASTARTIDRAASEVKTATRQLTSASQEMASNANTAASNIQQIHDAVSRLAAGSEDTASQITQANQITEKAHLATANGQELVSDLNRAMGQIHESAKKTEAIIGSIEAIAFQTKTLSFNASIEATHAGSAGSGFAVVAEEVLRLAESATKASVATKRLVEESRENARIAVTKFGAVNQNFNEIHALVDEMIKRIQAIEANIRTQNREIGTVRTSTATQDEISQSSAAMSEETAAAAVGLVEQVDHLRAGIEEIERLAK